MDVRSSLKRKSIVALGVYLCFFIATIGSVTYLTVEPPVRDKLQQNLDLRTQLLSAQIEEPINSSVGVLHSIQAVSSSESNYDNLDTLLPSMLLASDSVVVSGGVWPQPYTIDPGVKYSSLFYNKNSRGGIDRVLSWNNPQLSGYDHEPWYTSVVGKSPGTVAWSEVYIDPYTHVQMITASTPYYIANQFAGVATVDISLDELVKFVKTHAEDYSLGVLLRDSNNVVVVEHDFKIVDDIYISKFDFGEFNWQVEVVNAGRLVAEEVYEQVMSVEAGIVPFLLIYIMVGYYLLNRYLIKPITIIAQKVDDSHLGGIIDIYYKSQDEIRHLIDSFNQKTIHLDQERVKAQASTKAKTAFLATLSHEVRTPMNGVLGTAQILLKTKLDDEQKKYLKSLYDSGDHMMTLLNEILDFSKIEQGHLELDKTNFAFDSIIGSVNSVYHTLCTEKGLQFRVHSNISAERWYYSDKARLRQVLFNLLNNAVKFTSKGFVEVYFDEQLVNGQNFLIIRVRDTGIGIPKNAQERIFKPFEQAESSTTRRFGGTGLGLSIVKQIAELMEGGVSVTSEEGIGTSFEVRLAMVQCEPEDKKLMVSRKLNYQGLSVLIVEDNRTNTIIIDSFMKSKGFKTVCVENGELAIHAMQEHQFDLVLMDNHMPVMDGVESITAIRNLTDQRNDIVIFGCTADVFRETRERMLFAGADYIIAKPIDERELDDALSSHAERLFQFTQFDPEVTSSELIVRENEDEGNNLNEAMLVEFYIALENNQLPEALSTVNTMLGSVEVGSPLSDLLVRIKARLEQGVEPAPEDVDELTMSMA